MTDARMERLVGAFVLACAGTLAVMLLAAGFGEEWTQPAVHYHLVLDTAFGIAPGVDVTVHGMSVGRVEAVRLTLDRRVELVLHVDRGFQPQVRTDTRGDALLTLSGKIIEIGGGSPNSPVLEDGGTLVPGTNIDPLVDLQRATMMTGLDRLQSVLVDLEQLLAGSNLDSARIPELIDTVLGILTDLQAGRGTFGRMLQDDQVLDDVESAVAQIDGIAHKLDALATKLDATADRLGATSDAVSAQSESIAATGKAVERSSAAVEATAATIPPTMQSLEATLDELDNTLKAIQKLPLIRGKLDEDP
jgi:ABC-type transporter Mla subunit MlaD